MTFTLDQRLEESSFPVADWALCRVCLKNDKTLPWLYLVPRRDNIREIYDLSADDQVLLVREMALAAQALQQLYQPDKINTAALGNMVPMLHVHVFGRFRDDAAWPRPVWAVALEEVPYTPAEAQAEIEKLKDIFSAIKRKEEGRAA